MSKPVYGGPEMQAYTAQREREFAERQIRLAKVGGGERLDCHGRTITSPLITEEAIDSIAYERITNERRDGS